MVRSLWTAAKNYAITLYICLLALAILLTSSRAFGRDESQTFTAEEAFMSQIMTDERVTAENVLNTGTETDPKSCHADKHYRVGFHYTIFFKDGTKLESPLLGCFTSYMEAGADAGAITDFLVNKLHNVTNAKELAKK